MRSAAEKNNPPDAGDNPRFSRFVGLHVERRGEEKGVRSVKFNYNSSTLQRRGGRAAWFLRRAGDTDVCQTPQKRGHDTFRARQTQRSYVKLVAAL